MSAPFRLQSERLVLRDWREDDIDDLLQVCGDPAVMATIGPVRTRDEVAVLVGTLQECAASLGHTLWAMERCEDARVIGFTGLVRGQVPAIADQLEIGWRLVRDCWGQGLACEAARASLAWARANRPGELVVAMTARNNVRSRALMERLGMIYRPARDFAHPALAPDDPLRAHVVYEAGAERSAA